MNIILNLLVVTVSVAVAASRVYNPCKHYKHGSPYYLHNDPLDCTKYYSCSGKIAYHMPCPAGTSFDQGFQGGYGSCTGPDPKQVTDCYQQSRSRIKSDYSPWSHWSACSKDCGSGIQTRSRICVKQDNFHTYFCEGQSEDKKQCNIEPCHTLDTLSQWSEWSECPSCGRGRRRRTRTCIGPGDCDGLGIQEDEDTCPNLPKCQGTYGDWTDWSQCSFTCYDEGDSEYNIPKVEPKRGRTRKCLGGPDVTDVTCDNLGSPIEVVDCVDLPSCRGTLSKWSDWSDCSATCGEATRQRSRECVSPGDCHGLGDLTEFENCANLPSCQGISEFEAWSEWEDCSTTCGEGTRTRRRNCPGPYECAGRATESDICPENPKCTCMIKEEECQFATVAPVYYTQCKNDDTICSGGGGESDPCEGHSPDPEEMKFCTAKMAEISDLTDAQKPWVLCSEECFDGSGNPKNFTETTGCTAEVRKCKFPFIFHDMEYTECTDDLLFISDYDDRTKESFKWCATSTNDDNSMKKGKWGRCDEATCQ